MHMTSLHPNLQDPELKGIPANLVYLPTWAKVLSTHAESGVVSLNYLSPTSLRRVSVSLCFLRTVSTTVSASLEALAPLRQLHADLFTPRTDTMRACFAQQDLVILNDVIDCLNFMKI